MPPAKKADAAGDQIRIEQIDTQTMTFALIGRSPIILNRMSQKALHELLLPGPRKNAAERQATLKHDPYAEFRASAYAFSGDTSPTLLGVMPSTVKGSLLTAALDLPGTKKAQIGRLVYVEGDLLPLWGVPKLFMSVTRSADMNRTPDVRTRAIVPRWASLVSITFVRPILNERAIVNLLSAGGITAGIGDWRPEKGKGSYGQFHVTNATDPEFLKLCEGAGRAEQIAALEEPDPYDAETEELLAWFDDEIVKRGRRVTATASTPSENGKAELVTST